MPAGKQVKRSRRSVVAANPVMGEHRLAVARSYLERGHLSISGADVSITITVREFAAPEGGGGVVLLTYKISARERV